jgi:hypothetical protein
MRRDARQSPATVLNAYCIFDACCPFFRTLLLKREPLPL